MGTLTSPQGGGFVVESVPNLVSAASSATIDTYGSWVEVFASTGADSDFMIVQPRYITGMTHPMIADLSIGIGASGSEVQIVDDLPGTRSSSDVTVGGWQIPIRIPAGSRVAARAKNRYTSEAASVFYGVQLLQCGSLDHSGVGDRMIKLGDALVVGGMTELSAWTEIAASIDHDIKSLWFGLEMNRNTSTTPSDVWVDIGIGGSGSEEMLLENYYVRSTVWEVAYMIPAGPLPFAIAAGSRLSVRTKVPTPTNATDRTTRCMLWGLI